LGLDGRHVGIYSEAHVVRFGRIRAKYDDLHVPDSNGQTLGIMPIFHAPLYIGTVGYGGACPPPGKPHRYVFTVYALNEDKIKPEFDNIDAHSLGKASFTVKYGR
jgi:phosphatidylethanolamine-binding protein (PEBP) family uncharacterized protein